MHNKLIRIATGLFVLLFLASCGKEELMPMKIGNLWVYKTAKIDRYGTVERTDYMSLAVLADTVFSGQSYALIEGGFPLTNKEDGIYSVKKDSSSYSPALFFKYPAKLNDSYQSFTNDSITVMALDETVITPAGKFKCIKYLSRSSSMFDEATAFYLCPSTGIIKIEEYAKGNGDSLYLKNQSVLNSIYLK